MALYSKNLILCKYKSYFRVYKSLALFLSRHPEDKKFSKKHAPKPKVFVSIDVFICRSAISNCIFLSRCLLMMVAAHDFLVHKKYIRVNYN